MGMDPLHKQSYQIKHTTKELFSEVAENSLVLNGIKVVVDINRPVLSIIQKSTEISQLQFQKIHGQKGYSDT